jgi:hypothetical protein
MIKAVVKSENCKVLIPNKEHKNFTETNEILPVGTELIGEKFNIDGKRKGEDFTYRLFRTPEGKIIYPKYLDMTTTEVKLGVDGNPTPTVVNLKQAENFSKAKLIGVIGGGVAGFAIARYKKQDWKKSLIYSAVGAVVGFYGAYVFDRKRDITVSPSK